LRNARRDEGFRLTADGALVEGVEGSQKGLEIGGQGGLEGDFLAGCGVLEAKFGGMKCLAA
jgi:hypothetical protein